MRLFQTSLGSQSAGSEPTDIVDVILLTGQSNAAGLASDEDIPIDEQIQYSSKYWDKDRGWRQRTFSNLYTHGIELRLYQIYEDNPFYLVKYGVGSTAIIEHVSGGSVYEPFWNDYVIPAINDLINSGYTPRLKMVFIQGENDSQVPEVNVYGDMLDEWIDLWKTNLGNIPLNCVYIIETTSQDILINNYFNDASLVASNNLMQVENENLTIPFSADNLHYNYSAFQTLGDRLNLNLVIQNGVLINNPL